MYKPYACAAERNSDLKLLEAGQNEAGKSLVPKAIDADDDDGEASSDDDSDEVRQLIFRPFACLIACKVLDFCLPSTLSLCAVA